jgi:hypothetical protein
LMIPSTIVLMPILSSMNFVLAMPPASQPPISLHMDGAANGNINSSDVCVISSPDLHKAHVTQIGDSSLTNLPLVTAAAFVHAHRGPGAILLFQHQYAQHYGKGHTIHSTAQMQVFGTQARDSPQSQGGHLCLIACEGGYHVPALSCMDMCPPNDAKLHTLPHILLTSDPVCNPSTFDDELTLDELAQDAFFDPTVLNLDP